MPLRNRVDSKIARGSAELAILALLDEQPLYGFEIARRIGEKTSGAIQFTLASLYPMLYELERRALVKGQWRANKSGRDRRYYSLTAAGKRKLSPLRHEWSLFFEALHRLAGVSRA
jgi:PadR family transcriptional regulator, regulatory protein PadR